MKLFLPFLFAAMLLSLTACDCGDTANTGSDSTNVDTTAGTPTGDPKPGSAKAMAMQQIAASVNDYVEPVDQRDVKADYDVEKCALMFFDGESWADSTTKLRVKVPIANIDPKGFVVEDDEYPDGTPAWHITIHPLAGKFFEYYADPNTHQPTDEFHLYFGKDFMDQDAVENWGKSFHELIELCSQ